MTQERFSLSIIIPAYNEENRIGKTLQAYAEFFDSVKINYELIVVLNGCKDNTLEVVKKMQTNFSTIKYINIEEAIGKGGAIIEGFKISNGEIIGFTDADESTAPKMFNKLYEIVKELFKVDCIIGSRNLSGSVVKGRTSKRKLLTRGFNFGVNFLFNLNIKDTQCGAKLIRKKILNKVLPELTIANMAFDVNLLVDIKKAGGTTLEVPIEWTDTEESTISNPGKISIAMALSVIRLRLIYSPLRALFPIIEFFVRPFYKILVGKSQSTIYKKWKKNHLVANVKE